MNPASSTAASNTIITCSKLADIVVLALLAIFFFGFLAFDYELLGFHKSIIITIPNETEQYFEAIPWIIFGVLVFDIYLKYIIVGRDLKLLFKYHWLDISIYDSVNSNFTTSRVHKSNFKVVQGSQGYKVWI